MTHVKNAEAFSRLVDFCTGYGGTYNPGRQSLHIEVLVAQLSATRQAMQQVITAKAAFDNEVNFRKQVFDRLPPLVSRVLRTLEASGATPEKLEDARAFTRPITGYMSKRVILPVAEGQPVKPTRSNQQHAYVSKADAFANLIQAVASEPLYQPNEPQLGVSALTAVLHQLTEANQQVSLARVSWSNARIVRNEAMYHSSQSLLTLLRAVKKYVRSLFGLNSEQYAQVKVLRFTKPS
jgi:hypothetical protein